MKKGAAPEQPENPLEEDLFGAAFDEALNPSDTSKEGSEPPAASSTDEPAVSEQPKPAEPETPAPEPAQAPAAEPAATPDVKSVVAETLAALKSVEAHAPAPDPEPEAPQMTAEEIAAEEQFKKDWPEHYEREQKLIKQVSNLKDFISSMMEEIKGMVSPALQSAEETAHEKHIAAIKTAHPDAFDLKPQIEAWIKEQPTFARPQYAKILADGNTNEVIELLDTFKKANGIATPAATNTPDPRAEALRRENESALRKMETPGTVRTSATAEEDTDDFDAAFEIEAKKYK